MFGKYLFNAFYSLIYLGQYIVTFNKMYY